MRDYLRNIYLTVKTIMIGMRITLRYCFARTITVQYPDMAPTLQPRFRGFHYYEIEKCIACDLCAKACPVDCIYIEKTGPRKIDKETGVAMGGAMLRYAIDYSKCMFCALCTDPCPTDCIHMGDNHDLSGYDRASMVVEFTELAKQGLQTPMPIWMQKKNLPAWAEQRKEAWLARAQPMREEMLLAMTERKPAPKPAATKPAATKPAAEKPVPEKPAGDKPAGDKPAGDKPAAEKPPVDKSALDKSALDKSAVDKPAAEKTDGNGEAPAADEPKSALVEKPSSVPKPSAESMKSEKER